MRYSFTPFLVLGHFHSPRRRWPAHIHLHWFRLLDRWIRPAAEESSRLANARPHADGFNLRFD
jgi:hypothetical protein